MGAGSKSRSPTSSRRGGPRMTSIGLVHLIFAVVLVSVCIFAASKERQQAQFVWNARAIALVWSCTIVAASAVRQVRYPSDMGLYVSAFRQASAYDSMRAFLAGRTSDPGFSVFQYALAKASSDQRLLMGAIALVICLSFWLAIRLLLSPAPAVVVFFATTIFPFFAFYVANTARQGMAVALIVFALCAVCRNTRWMRLVAAFLLMVAVSLHLSAALPAAAVVLMMLRVPSVKASLWVWLASALLYMTGLNAQLLSFVAIADERFAQYSDFQAISGYAGGTNRLDFFALSAVLVIAVLWLHARSETGMPGDERIARILVSSFLLFNAVFLCLGFLAFSDRTAAYSWLMTPLVIGYLLFRGDRLANALERIAFVLGVCAITFATQGWPELLERTPIVG